MLSDLNGVSGFALTGNPAPFYFPIVGISSASTPGDLRSRFTGEAFSLRRSVSVRDRLTYSSRHYGMGFDYYSGIRRGCQTGCRAQLAVVGGWETGSFSDEQVYPSLMGFVKFLEKTDQDESG
jgi:hypothetical protein